MSKVVVLGSINIDMVLVTDRLPEIGETVIGKKFSSMTGGKGSNQAVAASRVGADVELLGKIGDDTFGQEVYRNLSAENLGLKHLETEKDSFTGIACVHKLKEDNCITVISGANEAVDTDYIKEKKEVIAEAGILLAQLEIPVPAVKLAFEIAKSNGVKTILNPAPYREEVSSLLELTDYITPNELEFESLIGKKAISKEVLEQEMLALSRKYDMAVIVTRGSKGVSFVNGDSVEHLNSIKVSPIDTTGAGDTFNGILLQQLASGVSLYQAVKRASVGASISTEKLGAQTGMPAMHEIEEHMI